MPRRDESDPDDRGGVEFVVGPLESGLDEDLPQPDDRGIRRSRWSLSFAVLAIVAVLVTLIVRAVATDAPDPVASTPSASSAPITPVFTGPSAVDGPVSQGPIAIRIDPSTGTAACARTDDGRSLCDTTHEVQPSVLAAVRVLFPGARLGKVVDEQLRDIGFGSGGIWFRSVRASQGSTHIHLVIRVVRVTDGPLERIEPRGPRTTVSVQRLTRTLVVRVAVTGPSAQAPTYTDLLALAGDKRLVE